MNPVMEGLLGGWRIVGINISASGVPVNLSYSPTSAFSVSGGPTYRPNLTGDPLTPNGGITNYLNRDTVVVPTDQTQPFGNAPRNAARGTSFKQLDLGLHKSFDLPGEQRRIEARIEAFNVFNHTNFQSAERQPLVERVRDDHLGVPGAPAAARRQVLLLVLAGRASRVPLVHLSAPKPDSMNQVSGCQGF